MTARVLVNGICVLAVVCAQAVAHDQVTLRLSVDYPEPGNYSLVTLTCNDEFGPSLYFAGFLRRAPGQDSPDPLLGPIINSKTTIILTQAKEGYFSCISFSGNTSSEIGLAAEPDVGCNGTSTVFHRYITFPTGDSSREVNLTCPIRPGALRERYNVQWESSIPGEGFTIVDTGNFDITEDINSTSRRQYQCIVTIQHSNDVEETYYCPMIILNNIVLATVEGEIENVYITRGGSAEFTCKFSKGDVDIVINWSVGDIVFDECASTEKDIAPDGNGCYTTDTESVLFLGNTSSFSTSNHHVQCVIQQNISDNFKKDPSFEESFNNITSNAILEIHHQTVSGGGSPDNGLTVGAYIGLTLSIGLIGGMILTLFCIAYWNNDRKEAPMENSGYEGRWNRDRPSRKVGNQQRMSVILRLVGTDYLTTLEQQDTERDQTSAHAVIIEDHSLSPHPTSGPIVDQDRPEFTETRKMTETDIEDALRREDSLTYSRETQISLPTSGPPIHPHNTREYIPTCFTPMATLSQCTHNGRWYYDKCNDFGLEIPAGAIPEGESITIDIGVALYGPFQYPEGLRPVSPVFWVCVRDWKNFQFSKPVKVTIPHCLNLESHDDIESLGLTFLKGDHEMNPQQMYQFQQASGDVLIESRKKYGVIQTTHFCSRCLSCKEALFLKKANFCMCSVIPEKFCPGQSLHAYFFITLLLPTCLTTVEDQIEKLGYKEKQQDEFQIGSDQTLEICLPQSLPAGWLVGMRGKKKIMMRDVDFFVNNFCEDTKQELEVREKGGMYPPRFHVVLSCSPSARENQTRIEFRGAVTDLVFDILLTPSVPSDKSLTTSSTTIEDEQEHTFGAVQPQASDMPSTRPVAACARGLSTSSSTSDKNAHGRLASFASNDSGHYERDVLTPLGERPTMPELLRFKIPQGVGGNCYTFGIFLLNDQTGGQVDTFKREYQGDAEGVVRRILREWLEGKGQPVTWGSLIKALRDTDLFTMADQIQDNLN